ncbi:Pyridoxal phosphate homeostasis protein [Pleurotus pulmonarius]
MLRNLHRRFLPLHRFTHTFAQPQRIDTFSSLKLAMTIPSPTQMPAIIPGPSKERETELQLSLKDVRQRILRSQPSSINKNQPAPQLVAVSKYKPAEDIAGCYNAGQRDFGENYVQELAEKAKKLPLEIRWHFIGTLQSNKAKILAAIPNLYCLQTLSSTRCATALSNNRPEELPVLNVMLQVNTSGEDSKSGLSPLVASAPPAIQPAELYKLASHVIRNCPRLNLIGLMTIGSIAESTKVDEENNDFERLKETRDVLERLLAAEFGRGEEGAQWGSGGKLLLSMGMSSDFEVAIRAGSDIVRVGTGIFGSRPTKA